MTADGAVAVPHDSFRAATLAQLSEVCVALGDIDAARALHIPLLAYQGQLIVVSWGVACSGATDRYLGMLEATMGAVSEAEGHYAAALTLEERATAPSQAARTRPVVGAPPPTTRSIPDQPRLVPKRSSRTRGTKRTLCASPTS